MSTTRFERLMDDDDRERAILAAARKVADAAVRYFEDHSGDFNLLANTFCALSDAVREYRALTESREVKS